MRAVKAKKLRKLARAMAPNSPARQLIAANGEKSVKVTNPKHPEFGKVIKTRTEWAVNHPQSVRGIYRKLKKQYMAS